ncbi:hypothetical protein YASMINEVIRUS_368 [Yasminevirus sp. GU-2018]|uniref:Fe2OG dioxygenase domain-containing protein n=1 Tax=Yasminevirus sp. GU-2018 TaxID=2420051 RepID=A0A5K0U7Y8_9VIRU|nr:hypothetical protein YASMINEVIRUS_368 [Yasminevirus sp. GU-2018]
MSTVGSLNSKRFMRTFDSYTKVDLPKLDLPKLDLSEVDSSTEGCVKSWIKDDILFIDGLLCKDWCDSVIKVTDPHYASIKDEYSELARDATRFLTLNSDLSSKLWTVIEPYFTEYIKDSVRPYDQTGKPVFTNRPNTPFGFGVKGVWSPLKINECFRFNKYVGSDSSVGFEPHRDSLYVEDYSKRSIYTILIYLNDLDDTGETVFLQPNLTGFNKNMKKSVYPTVPEEMADGYVITSSIKPKTGLIAIACHNRVHRGNSVKPGLTKYVVRSDIVFECVSRPENYSKDLWVDSELFSQAVGLYNDAKYYEMKGDVKKASECYEKGLAIRQNTYV